MEDTKRRLPPSLPANYVSFLDLRDRWLKQQQQKKQEEENQQKELQRNTEVQDEQERAEAELEDKSKGDDDQQEEPQPDEKSVVHLNPNPSNAIRRPSNGNRRQGEEANYRWVEVSKAKSLDVLPQKQAPAVTMIRPKQAPPIQASQSKPAPVAQVETKVLSVFRADKSKPLPSEVPKVETAAQAAGEIHGSDNKVNDRKLNVGNMKKPIVKNQRVNQKEDLALSRLNKGVLSTKGHLEWKADANIQEKPKALPVLQAYQLKPPLSEAEKAETAVHAPGEIHGSDKEVNDRKLNNRRGKKANGSNWKRNQQENLVQSQPNKGVLAAKADLEEKANTEVQLEPKSLPVLHSNQSKPPPFEVLKVDRAVQPPTHSSDEVVNAPKHHRGKKKKKKAFKKRNQKVEDVLQPQLKKDGKEKENPGQEVVAVRETKDANDNSRAETEGNLAGLSLTCAPVESCSRGSIVAKNRKGWRKDGSYAKFERRVMLKTERARCEGSLVWVKKGESSQSGAVTVENAGSIRVTRQ